VEALPLVAELKACDWFTVLYFFSKGWIQSIHNEHKKVNNSKPTIIRQIVQIKLPKRIYKTEIRNIGQLSI
jgi:hypothetical protein